MKTNKEKPVHLLHLSPEKIMKDFLLEKEGEFNEEKTNELISEIELSLKQNLLAVKQIFNFFYNF